MPERERKQFIRFYLIAVLFCCIFFLGGMLLIDVMARGNEKDDRQYVTELTNQNRMAIEAQINGDLQTMEGIASCIGAMSVADFDILHPMLKEINDRNTFIRMGLANVDGSAVWVDLGGEIREADLSEEPIFQEAMTGVRSVSSTRMDLHGMDAPVLSCAVPIRQGDAVIGVLLGVNSLRLFSDRISESLLGEDGYLSIVDRAGNYLVRPEQANAQDGLFSLTMEEETATRVRTDLVQGRNGLLAYRNSQGDEWLCVYQAVEQSDWYLLGSVPQHAIKKYSNRTVVGVVFIFSTSIAIFTIFLIKIWRLTERSRQPLELLAYQDALTGCRSYTKFLRDAQQRIESGGETSFALWYCDIKRFKYLNDLFGYKAGDQVLKALAALLSHDDGSDFLSCRISADNFAGLRIYRDRSELVDWYQEIVQQLSDPGNELASRFHVEVQIGIFCAEGALRGESLENMINWANMARKSIKETSGSNYTFYTGEMRENARRETDLESRMVSAMVRGEFEIYFQPKINIQRGDIVTGAEALARWNSEALGRVFPNEFIPLFERNGFIVQLDRFMFEQACQWLQRHLELGGIPINLAVNVSRMGLLQEDFVEYYVTLKEFYQIPDRMIELEFTESVVLDDDANFRRIVRRLQGYGFVCALDDFGTGYSSLNILKDLPMDVLKLDMLFFHGEDEERARVVVSNVLSLAHALKIKTVSEGVETPTQVEFLRALGCDVVQGYVFARPMSAAQFDQALEEHGSGPWKSAAASPDSQ